MAMIKTNNNIAARSESNDQTSTTPPSSTARKDSKPAIDKDSTVTTSPSPPDNMGPRMVHLKTKEECRLKNETIQVWSVELPSKHAEGILKVIKESIPGQDAIDLQHLRRFAKPKFLPAHILGRRNLAKEMHSVPRTWDKPVDTVMQAHSGEWDYAHPVARSKASGNNRPPTLHLLICPVHIISKSDLEELLLTCTPFASSAESWAYPLEIQEVTVPLQPPTKPEIAAEWSNRYWPTFYRKTNPFGAHPATISKAEDELRESSVDNHSTEQMLSLAEQAAGLTQTESLGLGTGCSILERGEGKTNIIAVAGDARRKPLLHSSGDEEQQEGADLDTAHGCKGNVMGHAIMRAIGMVGRKRLRCASAPLAKAASKAERSFHNCGLAADERARDAFFLDLPLNGLEKEYFEEDNIRPDGYLCLKLEVFLTHEPCVMCSMALVHSRVGKVIFRNRMGKTGGLTAEVTSNDTGPVGLGYGLCWRKELNWQFMCWEYVDPTKLRAIEESNTKEPINDDATKKKPKKTDPLPLVAPTVEHAPIFSKPRGRKGRKFPETPVIADPDSAPDKPSVANDTPQNKTTMTIGGVTMSKAAYDSKFSVSSFAPVHV
ncbi:hypothetical protein MBLNU230_g8618t2 [Neophaeotheca triangularis]